MDLFPSATHVLSTRNISNKFTASEAGFMLDSADSGSNLVAPLATQYRQAGDDHGESQLFGSPEQDETTMAQQRRRSTGLLDDALTDAGGNNKPHSTSNHTNNTNNSNTTNTFNKYSSLFDEPAGRSMTATRHHHRMMTDSTKPRAALNNHHDGGGSTFRSSFAAPRGSAGRRSAGISQNGSPAMTSGGGGSGGAQDPLSGLKRKVLDLTTAKDNIVRSIREKEETLKKLLQKVEEKNSAVKTVHAAILKARERLAEKETESGDLELKVREKTHLLKNLRDENVEHGKTNKMYADRLQKLMDASKAAQREVAGINGRIGTLKAGLDVQLQGNQGLFSKLA